MSLGPELSKDNSADVVTVDGEEEVAHARNLLFASLILRHLLPVCRDWRQRPSLYNDLAAGGDGGIRTLDTSKPRTAV